MENLTIPENTTLVTMDVTSLYTNIPHDDGIAACRKRWEQRTVQEPPTECLVEMLTLVLKNNNFTFDGSHYLQINGTAMGTKMAPSYANIFMGDLAELLLLSSLKQPLSLFRFIDEQYPSVYKIHTRSVENQIVLPWYYHYGHWGQHDNWFIL